jgi:CBS domain containing-hemolysin-like protein
MISHTVAASSPKVFTPGPAAHAQVLPILIIAGLTLLASFFCSLSEAALYSLSPARIAVLQQRGSKSAKRLAKMRENIEDPIAAILTINTIAHTIGSAWCGALVGQVYGSKAVGMFAAVFTVLVLALTEIIPKSLGVRYAHKLGPQIALPLQVMIWAVYPIVWIARKAMHVLAGTSGPVHPSEDEVITTAGLAAKGGQMRHEEHRWVQNALRLDRVTAGDLMTPRSVVEALPADTPVNIILERADQWIHSRTPVTSGTSLDQVIGLVHRREVADSALLVPDAHLVLRDLLRPIQRVPNHLPAHQLLELFLKTRAHMVAVTDVDDRFEGVVTLEDVLECMLGAEIVDEYDQTTNMQALAIERARSRRRSNEGPSEPPLI